MMTTTGDAGPAVTTWNYDPLRGWLTSKVYPAAGGSPATAGATGYDYWPSGRLKTRTWARQSGGAALTTSYSYNAAGDLALTDYSDATPDVSATYTRFGQLATVTDAVGSRSFGYRTASDLRLESERIQSSFYTKHITRKYDALGRNAGFKVGNTANSGDDYEVTYGYDNTGRLGTVAGPDQATFTYGYEPNSARNLIASVSGPVHTVTNVLEPNRDVLDQKINQVGTTTVSSYDYGVNRIGQRTAVAGTSNYNYWYNGAGELVTADHASDGSRNRAYAYDGIGNRLWESQAHDAIGGLPSEVPSGGQSTDYVSNELNQYTAVGAVVPAHDSDGNLTAFGAKSYAWDAENRLIEVSENGGLIATFSYDYLGRRVRRTVGGVGDTFYVHDGWNLIGEYSTATPLQPLWTWTWGLDLSGTLHGAGGVGGLLAMLKPQLSASQFYTFDGNGNVSELLDEQGAVVGHYEYDPFGKEMIATGPAANVNAFRFSTKFHDDEIGLIYYGYRYYNVQAGRWLNRDPLADEAFFGFNTGRMEERARTSLRERAEKHLYTFVANASPNRVDPLGLDFWSNASQALWCCVNPRCCKWAKDMKSDINGEQGNRYGNDPDNGVINAIKHCALMCRVAGGEVCSDEATRKLGNAHENFWGDNPNSRMDLFNNDAGIDASQESKTLDECYDACERRALEGELRWDSQDRRNDLNPKGQDIVDNTPPTNNR